MRVMLTETYVLVASTWWMLALIVSVHPFFGSTQIHMPSDASMCTLRNKMNNDRGGGHCYILGNPGATNREDAIC